MKINFYQDSSDIWAGIVAGKYKKSEEEFNTVRKQSSGDVLPNKPAVAPVATMNRSQTTSDVVNTNTVKLKINGNSGVSSSTVLSNSKIKYQNNNYLNGAVNGNGANPVYKRNLSGFGRGKFVTNPNLNNRSVGKIDRISFSSASSEPTGQHKQSNDEKKGNPFFY